jgi:hypothetical protein
MLNFNSNFYQPNFKYTREIAEQRLISLGYKNFSFVSASYTNGASFYFTSEEGKEIRVSDHPLTGKRAFETIDVAIVEIKVMESPLKLRERYLSQEITKKEYKQICKEKGFIFKP